MSLDVEKSKIKFFQFLDEENKEKNPITNIIFRKWMHETL